METLPFSAEASTTTAVFHLLRSESASERICWRSMPSSRAASTFDAVHRCAPGPPARRPRLAPPCSFNCSISLIEGPLRGQQFLHVLDQLRLGRPHQFGDAPQRAGGLLVLPQGRFAGDGLDAPHAGRDAAFVHDLADADIAGAPDVRAAAQLAAEAGHGNHANLFAVLFAEQRHGAGGDGLVERHDLGLDPGVAQDLLVHEPLHFLDFGAVHGGVVGEVEAQAARAPPRCRPA